MSKKGWAAALESGLKMSGETGPAKELGWLMIAKFVSYLIIVTRMHLKLSLNFLFL